MGLDTKSIEELKRAFNSLLERIEKGAKWLDDKSRTEDEIKRYYPPFAKMIDAATLTIIELEKKGCRITSEEMQIGFKEVGPIE